MVLLYLSIVLIILVTIFILIRLILNPIVKKSRKFSSDGFLFVLFDNEVCLENRDYPSGKGNKVCIKN